MTALHQWLLALSPPVTAFTSDSRLAGPATVFVAIKGGNTDGHEFVQQALAQGCAGAVVSQTYFNKNLSLQAKLFPTDDNHETHRAIAGFFRERYQGKIIAIGGSSGKTSTKEFLFQILSKHFPVFKTYKSQNGELGIPKTLEQLSSKTKIGIIEVGIDAPGDMIRHATLVAPDIAILTSIGEEHLNLLKSVENVFKEEKILFDITLARGGRCFAPEGDSYLKTLAGTHPSLFLCPTNTSKWKLKLTHPYAIQNAILAAQVALDLGMPEAKIHNALPDLEMPDGRGQEFEMATGHLLLADHYNANPSSLRAGLRHAKECSQRRALPLVLILGDMLDLGPETKVLHKEIAEDINSTHADLVVLVGPEMKAISHLISATKLKLFLDSREASRNIIRSDLFEKAVILFKGSRGMALEHSLEAVKLMLQT
jgi:UDP-N-acetylmuramoyl-tripeptide--D-alanyl-D-alanine ligase